MGRIFEKHNLVFRHVTLVMSPVKGNDERDQMPGAAHPRAPSCSVGCGRSLQGLLPDFGLTHTSQAGFTRGFSL